jgi:hypothetical protein
VVATVVGGIALSGLVFAAAMYWFIPKFRMARRLFRIDGGAMAASLAICAMLLTGCADAPKNRAVVVIDTTSSAQMTDQERTSAVWKVLARLPRCYSMVVLPVNGEIRDSLRVELPCTDDRGYGDDLKQVYAEVERDLPNRLRAWASSGGVSDYQHALKLASEQLTGESRALIVIGDMEHTGCLRDQCAATNGFPDLNDIRLSEARIFLGFVPSSRGRATAEFQAKWKDLIVGTGTRFADVQVRAFGLEGLSDWCADIWPNKNDAYARWEARKAR